VTFGFIVWLLSFIVGAGYLGPESGRLGNLVDERGPPAQPDLHRLPHRAPPADPGGARHDRQAGSVGIREVYVGDRYLRFGDLTAADARELAFSSADIRGGSLE
jgi:hypothetical protein